MQKWNFNVTVPLWDWVRRDDVPRTSRASTEPPKAGRRHSTASTTLIAFEPCFGGRVWACSGPARRPRRHLTPDPLRASTRATTQTHVTSPISRDETTAALRLDRCGGRRLRRVDDLRERPSRLDLHESAGVPRRVPRRVQHGDGERLGAVHGQIATDPCAQYLYTAPECSNVAKCLGETDGAPAPGEAGM